MTSRTQITLSPELQKRAKERASQLGISFAEYIRRLVAIDLKEPAPPTEPSAVFDLGGSGGSDIARDKDKLLGEASAAEHQLDR